MMGWTHRVHCKPCHEASNWDVKGGVWTCFHCGSHMTVTQIAAHHKTLCHCSPKERVTMGYMCQTCHKPTT